MLFEDMHGNIFNDEKETAPASTDSIVITFFYKKYWQLVRDSVVHEVLHMFCGGYIREGWNDTIMVLIPKVKNPRSPKDLHPISLCNIMCKLVPTALQAG